MSQSVRSQVLRAKVRGLQAAGSTVSSRIRRASGLRRHQLWLLKRRLGSHCRHHMLAHALLRGVPYQQVEKRCSTGNRPDPQQVLAIAKEHVAWPDPQWMRSLDLAAVQTWLAVTSKPAASPPPPHGSDA